MQSLNETSNCLWEEVPMESRQQACPLVGKEARPETPAHMTNII